jgi:hypothetical protein
MWDSIAWTESDFFTKQGGSEKVRRLVELRQGEPQRALRPIDAKPAASQKRSASQSSLRFTPPLPSTMVAANQIPKQRSRLDLLIPPSGDNHMLTII